MLDFVDTIAANEGWTDQTTVSVLCAVLDELNRYVRTGLIEELIEGHTAEAM